VRDEDIVGYDAAAATWSIYFDASDVGITVSDLDAFHIRNDGSILLSFSSDSMTIPGLTGGPDGELIDDSDIVLFTPNSVGETTAGVFSFYFDGSDVGLDASREDIDGLFEFQDGSLGISTVGGVSVPGVVDGNDSDVLRFSGTFGSTTSGTWSLYFDGSDVGLATSNDDLDAVSLDGTAMLFSTSGSYVAAGGSGDDEDVSRFEGSFGDSTSGTASLVLDGSSIGLSGTDDIDGLSYGAGA
jgi:hypothetical protein